MAASRDAGPFMIKSTDNRQFFMFGHPEYDADTLANEYWRDVNKGLAIKVPVNYFPDDNPTRAPIVTWRSTGQLIFSNWLNFYVYQTTPYDLHDLKNETPQESNS
jgi:homoserine O-succinyltransferase